MTGIDPLRIAEWPPGWLDYAEDVWAELHGG